MVLASLVVTARQVWASVEVCAEAAHDLAENRRVIVLADPGEG